MARLLFLMMVSLLGAIIAAMPRAFTHADQPLTSWDFEQQTDVEGWHWSDGEFARVADPIEADHAARLTANGTSQAVTAVYLADLLPGATYRFSGAALVSDAAARLLQLEVQWTRQGGGFFWKRAELTPLPAGWRALATPLAPIPCDVAQSRLVLRLERSSGPAATAFVDDLQLDLVDQASCAAEPPPPAPRPTATPTPRPAGSPGPDEAPGGAREPDERSVSGTASNLLANPGFELAAAGRPLAWEDYGGVLLRVSAPVHGGRYAGGFSSASGSTKWAHQTVRVQPAAWYAFEAYVWMNDPRVEAAFLRISWYTSADGSGSAVASADSTEILQQPRAAYRLLTTGAVQAPAGVHSARARVVLRPRSSAGATIYIDDATFRPSDAPGVKGGAGAAAGAGDASAGDSSSGGSFSGSGFSSVLGERSGARPRDVAPFPTPVIARDQRSAARSTPSARGEGGLWWPWALAGVGALAAGGGGVWWWGRRRFTRET